MGLPPIHPCRVVSSSEIHPEVVLGWKKKKFISLCFHAFIFIWREFWIDTSWNNAIWNIEKDKKMFQLLIKYPCFSVHFQWSETLLDESKTEKQLISYLNINLLQYMTLVSVSFLHDIFMEDGVFKHCWSTI